MCDDAFAGHGGAAAFDHVECGVDLVGAVEEEVDAVDVVEWDDAEVERACEEFGGVAGGDAGEVEVFALVAEGECADGAGGGPAGAEADDGARFDEHDGGEGESVVGGVGGSGGWRGVGHAGG